MRRERPERRSGSQESVSGPRTLRHSFACHTFENGCDIRHIQKVLGHVRLETTTIYVRVARPADGKAIPSPLDVMRGSRNEGPGSRERPVGRLKIHLRPNEPDERGLRSGRVTLGIGAGPRPVYLTGIVAREVRRGWVSLEIPPLETWEEPLRWLRPEQRERIEDARFFEMLQREVPRRLLSG